MYLIVVLLAASCAALSSLAIKFRNKNRMLKNVLENVNMDFMQEEKKAAALLSDCDGMETTIVDLRWQLDASNAMLETALSSLPEDHMLNFNAAEKNKIKSQAAHDIMHLEVQFDNLFKKHTDVENERSEAFLNRFESADTEVVYADNVPVRVLGTVPAQRHMSNGDARFKDPA